MSSPSRKRMRLSSPTYDAGLEDFDDSAIEELDRIEFSLSQQMARKQTGTSMTQEKVEEDEGGERCRERSRTLTSSSQRGPPSSQTLSPGAKKRRMENIMAALSQTADPDNSQHKTSTGFGRPSKSVTRAESAANQTKSLMSPDDDCGLGEPADTFPGFSAASEGSSFNTLAERSYPGFSTAGPSTVGFATAGNMKVGALKVSDDALKLALMKMAQWSEEIDAEVHVDEEDEVLKSPSKQLPPKRVSAPSERPPLASIVNTPRKKGGTQIQHGFVAPKSFTTPLRNGNPKTSKTFKSPLLRNSSPLPMGLSSPPKSQRLHPLASTPIVSGFSTPVRSRKPPSSHARSGKPTFSTPFKPGMAPGEPGRLALELSNRTPVRTPVKSRTPLKHNTTTCLNPRSLQGCGMVPQQYTFEELEDRGVNISELCQITPQTAPFYCFHTSSPDLFPSSQSQRFSPDPQKTLGPQEAFEHLTKTGRATSRKWVDNHWVFVLWKLAGMAAFDPASEANPLTRRWCWSSVLSQLESRHDREFERGSRPALRMIVAQDKSPATPMVLIVVGVNWAQHERRGEDGKVVEEACAEIDVSDGWYRVKAQVDAPIARAILKGTIKSGTKIAMSGARLDCGREPKEVLDGYSSCTLLLSGNSTSLAPWHATLGFQPEPFYATLRSLTSDGGLVPMIAFVVEKVYPFGFFEFFPGSKPKEKRREGPRSESEEAEIHDKWQKRYDIEEAKVSEEVNARWERWDSLAARLEQASSSMFSPSEDEAQPDHIENLFDDLDELPPEEVGNYIRNLAPDECGWLARYLRRRAVADRELAPEEISVETQNRCPPREVRNFRIVAVRDAFAEKKPANRLCHLTIWDVLSICVSEGAKPGVLEIGQKFAVTNLQPMQQNSWMGQEKDDMVYLSTRKTSRFMWLK